jgi:hypothetical protein
VSVTADEALGEIAGAMQRVVDLTKALATITDCFQQLLDAIEAVRVDRIAGAAEAALAAGALNAR